MATVPRFNPNQRHQINPELERNRPVTDTFEPGSTFKIVTMTGGPGGREGHALDHASTCRCR